jgi:hypothetical protein
MNALTAPRFTAEASVYASTTPYRAMGAGVQVGGAEILPAQDRYESSLYCGPCRLTQQNKFPWFAWRKSCVLFSRFSTPDSGSPWTFEVPCDPFEEGAHTGEI